MDGKNIKYETKATRVKLNLFQNLPKVPSKGKFSAQMTSQVKIFLIFEEQMMSIFYTNTSRD